MSFTIKGNKTPKHDAPGLCATCRHSHIAKGAGFSQEETWCTALFDAPRRLNYQIYECNSFDDKTLPTLRQYEQIAWVINADPKKKQMGFMTPDQYRDAVKNGKVDDVDVDDAWHMLKQR